MALRLASSLLGALVAALLFVAPATAGISTHASKCRGTDVIPSPRTLVAVERATLCLINGERTRRGRRPLTSEGRLARAADRHVADMIRYRYFAHDGRDGSRFSDRIRATGYLSRAGGWTVGENLAWGTGTASSADAIVRAWMRSPGHRANILNGRFRQIGIGLAVGTPHGRDGATYATEFGAVTARVGSARRARR